MPINRTCCPICGSKNITVANGIGKCSECGHGFRTCIPDEILPKYFEKQYWDNDKNRQGITTVTPDGQWKGWVNARIKILEDFGLLNHSDPGKIRILEFGCAEGMLLYALKQKGYNVMGNDICAVADESMAELGINISRLPIEEFAAGGGETEV